MSHKTINIQLSGNSIDDAIKQLELYKEEIKNKTHEVCEKLADIIAEEAESTYSEAFRYARYVDKKGNSLGNAQDFPAGAWEVNDPEETDDGYIVRATGDEILFIEFGAGATYGEGHPDTLGEFGVGTYPGKGHWNDPNGWTFYDNNSESGLTHTYGNEPFAGMYYGRMMAEQSIDVIADEVFG